MCIELPPSYRAYLSDAAVRTAVDRILSADSRTPLALPADIEWQGLPAFHRAVLSGRGMGAVKRISHVEAKPTRCCLSAGNGICRALSSSAWRFWTRILAPT